MELLSPSLEASSAPARVNKESWREFELILFRADGSLLETMAMSYELLMKERDELQREVATANAELFAVLKQSEYRSADEISLVCNPPMRHKAARPKTFRETFAGINYLRAYKH